MCGIAGLYLKDSFHGQYDVDDLVDGLLLGIESRGRDATGYVAVRKGGEVALFDKTDAPAKDFVLLRENVPSDLRFALLHTRLATKGATKDNENNHPVLFKTCFATHNGVIRNDDELFDDLLNEQTRVAEVDSIVVPTLVHSCGGMDKALENLPKLVGSWALAIADPTEKPDEVLLVRGSSSPLVVLNHPKLVMWASTVTALKDAWELAIGTPPKHNKYTTLDEGEFIRIKEGGLVETGRFMEKPVYQSTYRGTGSSRNFRTPHDYETSHSSWEKKPMCFECGERQANYSVIDSYRDEEAGRSVEWDVPVCWGCRTTVPADLSYRYATEKLRVRYRRDDDICELCQTAPGAAYNSVGARLCVECMKAEPKAAKFQQSSFKGEAHQKYLTLNPGDLIPFELRSAFTSGCASCESQLVSYLDGEGFAICGLCKIAEDKAGEESSCGVEEGVDCIKCDNCDFWYPMDKIKVVSAFGTICEDCCEEQGWVQMPAHIEEKRPNFLPYLREADEAYPEGCVFMPCERKVAFKLNIHLPFVAWLLHKCTKDHLDDPALTEVWDKVTAAYTFELAETEK